MFKSNTKADCGPEENRTLHSLLAREKRQPWNMRAHFKKLFIRTLKQSVKFGPK